MGPQSMLPAIERRRTREQQRQSRIFNAKARTIGVVFQRSHVQVEEKKIRESTEKRHDKNAQMLEQKEQEISRNLVKAGKEFREYQQQPETRREFDIYDPEGLKKDRPMRISDDDPRCGPASLQKFAGEDLSEKERKKMQAELTKRWLSEQKEERQRNQAQQKFADPLDDKKRVEVDERAQYLSLMEEECRKAIDVATTNFNQALALETEERRSLQKQQEHDNNSTEIYNHLTGDILTEDPAVATNCLSPHRVLPDRWKGMSPEQLQAIRDTQEQQRREKQRLDEEERQRDSEWEKQRMLGARAAMTTEQQEDEINKELRKRLDAYSHQLSREQRAHLQYLEKEVYTNNPTAHYFTQFNTTSR
uniref:RIB43A-like with coiled-coils protein 1 n=1 Tax=Leptobrachium leishanense TaxID=445787 RepID=A0A8C5MNU3_9ANUR